MTTQIQYKLTTTKIKYDDNNENNKKYRQRLPNLQHKRLQK